MSDLQRRDGAKALVEAARRRSAAAPRLIDAAPSPADAEPAAPSAPPPRRGWRHAALYIARWVAIGVAIALAWQVLRPPRTFEGFALRLLTAAGLLTIFTLLRDPSSLAIVGAPRFLLPGAGEASAQRAAFLAEIERAEREPPWTIYRFVAVVTLVAIALILLVVT